MNRCSKCNNELIAGARFCNICGTPVAETPATPVDSAAPAGIKRTIQPEIRHVRPARASQPIVGSLVPDEPGTPDKLADNEGSDAPASAPSMAPVVETPEQVKAASSPATSDPDETVPLPPPPDKTVPLPQPNAGTNRAPGIIRPIVSSESLRRNTPIPPAHMLPNPMSPLPALPNTPPLPVEKARQTENTRFPRPVNTPAPGSSSPNTQRQPDGPQSLPVPARQPGQPSLNNNPGWQQNRVNSGASQTPQMPQPSLHDVPTSYLERPGANSNGANSTAARQELPLFSPESFAYTSKAAQHWRSSWRDLQNVEAGPAQDVSKGQAEVSAPLASRKDSFLRMRAIRSKQNVDGGEKNFGFWVTFFLMVCLIGGLAAYIIYSYLPGTSGAARLTQPTGAAQPTFAVVGGSAQTFIQGQSLRAQGAHFGDNDPIQFLLDSTTPILASTGSPLSIQTDSHGSFAVTILVGKDWTVGAHVLSATDSRANLSAYLNIQVNPDSTPAAGNNNTELAFSLNGQPITGLSFTAQLSQSAPPAQRITFTNISGSPMQWTAAASTTHNLNWLTIVDSDFAGQLDISEPHTMGISVNPTGLTATGSSATDPNNKPYAGQIVFTINGKTQLTLGVQLTIVDATPEMVFSPNPLVATATGNGSCQPGATLTFINLGTTAIRWSANPDDKNNIQFVNNKGILTESGTLQSSGIDGDTFVVTLQCSGVKAGQQYTVRVYVNNNSTPFIEIVQID